jgi:hypothetical protein
MVNAIEYPPGPKDLLPYSLVRKFLRDPLKMLTTISQTYGLTLSLVNRMSIS